MTCIVALGDALTMAIKGFECSPSSDWPVYCQEAVQGLQESKCWRRRVGLSDRNAVREMSRIGSVLRKWRY